MSGSRDRHPKRLCVSMTARGSLSPIAGTRPRGSDTEEDLALEKELLADPKENAEHVMLVDLARNDLGRVAAAGSVHVDPFRKIERYSHVMHIVSGVLGEIVADKDALDLFAATFPAGTLVGAPKVRAMELIAEMEPVGRGLYGGTVGYFAKNGNMDQAITIRTMVFHRNEYKFPGWRRHRGRQRSGARVPGGIGKKRDPEARPGDRGRRTMSARLLLIDNYDSFTYNLVQAFLVLEAEVIVHRNDAIDIGDAMSLAPTHLVISPGPGRPEDAGRSLAMIEAFAGKVPMLGVCLGHQCIVQHFGGEIVAAGVLMHGKTSQVEHDGYTLYRGLPSPFLAGRYHSLAANRLTVPDELQISATTDVHEIMGVRHKELPIEGVQFHPESVLTPQGPMLLENFLYPDRAAS